MSGFGTTCTIVVRCRPKQDRGRSVVGHICRQFSDFGAIVASIGPCSADLTAKHCLPGFGHRGSSNLRADSRPPVRRNRALVGDLVGRARMFRAGRLPQSTALWVPRRPFCLEPSERASCACPEGCATQQRTNLCTFRRGATVCTQVEVDAVDVGRRQRARRHRPQRLCVHAVGRMLRGADDGVCVGRDHG